MHLKLISCEMFQPEIQAALARSNNNVEVEFLPKALHQLPPDQIVRALQTRIDQVRTAAFHAVLLAAGSCKHAFAGLTARTVPLVLPRAKDCISLLLQGPGAPSVPLLPPRARVHPPRRRPRIDRSLCQRSPGAYWVVPVQSPVPGASHRAALSDRYSRWDGRFAWSPSPDHSSGAEAPAVPSLSLLDMLIEGYWNYTDFLVVAPGWRVVVNEREGTIAAEEMT
ncbi:MAG: DUF1638 domain-containing protein [Verrucomicrobiota bacterium]